MKWMVMAGVSLAVMACSSPQDVSAGIGLDGSDKAKEASATEDETPVAGADPRVIEVNGEGLSFTYEWPAKAAQIEELNALMEEKSAAALAEYQGYVAEGMADAKKYDYRFNPYMFGMGWELAGEAEGLLSLAGAKSTYTGGAHGNAFYEALVWDKAAKAVLATSDVFASPEALDLAVREPYCTKLSEMRAERVGREMTAGTDIFASCPALSELAIVLVSSEAGGFDQIDFVAAPYVAGSYAEGEYLVALTVTDAVVEAVKPEYRANFTTGGS
ncbi:MAG: DUF4163 domain-containing protein [Pseudomonadota bacterium]